MRVKLFEENNVKKNALSLCLITLFFCFIGSHLRIPEEFSLFWPVNALIAGLMVRNRFYTTSSYLVCFAAMIFNDTVFSGWALPAVTINFANILFITVSVSMLIKHLQSPTANSRYSTPCASFRRACSAQQPAPPGCVGAGYRLQRALCGGVGRLVQRAVLHLTDAAAGNADASAAQCAAADADTRAGCCRCSPWRCRSRWGR